MGLSPDEPHFINGTVIHDGAKSTDAEVSANKVHNSSNQHAVLRAMREHDSMQLWSDNDSNVLFWDLKAQFEYL